MFEVSGLSKKDIQEEYEDLVFRKVMAIYVENESKQILAEIRAEKESTNEPVDTKAVEKLYDKKERRENLSILWKYSKKVVGFAAMVVFVAIVSLSSAVVAFADVREAVIEVIYHLVYEENEKYTQITIGESTSFINPEIYSWEDAYAPTYMTLGYEFSELKESSNQNLAIYCCDDKYVAFSQSSEGVFQIDTEDATVAKEIIINDSKAIYVEKNGFVIIVWNVGENTFSIRGTIDPEEAIKIAKSIKKIK